ncbi:hypothetical protein EGK_16455, partial [Macaca mulatta]
LDMDNQKCLNHLKFHQEYLLIEEKICEVISGNLVVDWRLLVSNSSRSFMQGEVIS